MKKIFAVLMALVLALSLSVASFAAETESGEISAAYADFDPASVTADDELYITVAYEVYNMLNDKTKSYLTAESQILEKLLAAVENLPSEESEPESEIVEVPVETEKIVYREASGKDYLIQFSNKKLSRTVWIMIILAVAACLNTAVIYVYSLCYKRKINSIVNNAVEERRGDI